MTLHLARKMSSLHFCSRFSGVWAQKQIVLGETTGSMQSYSFCKAQWEDDQRKKSIRVDLNL